ncbi:MAG: hypothetical protein F6K36_03685 [Symploca sp. SIO3C6]|uniref:Uncharacterized protein n=1 Tax=Symploca sp. SIO1C4 TaxID=2607765 RepID=A0A6B3ND22_9CYAN|nr:hypothetical protein [Symploca sp. SIO3C6]NER27994.1 hypothetical protein [Symploca sp. SIO1C4]NET05282.1 hypothetical protein [Symploca sp. SIO2B6]
MSANNTKLSISVEINARRQLLAFQKEHKLNSLSSAVSLILKNYFQEIQGQEPAQEVAPTADSELINILSKRLDELGERLAVVEAQLRHSRSSDATKIIESLQITQSLKQPQDATYGSGEAADLYLGWEVPANISYVFNRYQSLNTDEAKAAFADKWISLCANSLETALVVCYSLLSLVKDNQMYQTSHWMEGYKTYTSFKNYFEHRFESLLEKWSQMELVHKFVVENCPQILEAMLRSQSIELSKNGSVDVVIAQQVASPTTHNQPQTRLELSKVESTEETPPVSIETIDQIQTSEAVEHKLEQLEKELSQEPPQPEIILMTTSEVSQFSGLTTGQLNRYKHRGTLPIEVSVEGVKYRVDYAKKGEQGRNLWSVQSLEAKEKQQQQQQQQEYSSASMQSVTEAASIATQTTAQESITPILTQTALSERLDVPRSTFRRKKNQMSEAEFAEWTSSNDPDGIAWAYSEELKQYYVCT